MSEYKTIVSDYETTGQHDHRTKGDPCTRRGRWSHLRAATARQAVVIGLSSTRQPHAAFTLAELVVSVGVLVLLVLLFTQFLNSAANITMLGHKKMDADSEARQVLDRMAFDFAQLVKRPDIDYYLKSSSGPASDCQACGPQTGNDQAAFYSSVPGYYSIPTPTPAGSPIDASPVSLVSYRVNSDSASAFYNKMERMGKALAWNGVFANSGPNSSLTPMVFLPQTIANNWCQATITGTPSATCTGTPDPNYEVIGPQVFRFEYYYLLTNEQFSGIPFWSTAAVSGMRDVAAIVVVIAVIDPKTKALVSDCQLAQLNGAPLPAGCGTPAQYPVLIDWGNTSCLDCPSQTDWQTSPGLLAAQWRAALDANTISLPQPAISGIRVYERYFYLTH